MSLDDRSKLNELEVDVAQIVFFQERRLSYNKIHGYCTDLIFRSEGREHNDNYNLG